MSFQLFKRKLLPISVLAGIMQLPGVAMAQDEPVLEEVVVTGIRASLARSVDIKRNAGSVVDAITATDIGKLPDATIADSLQRIPGIQIGRSAGEGASVNIRGNGNITTTLNGEQMLPAGSITTVSPDFADVPSTMVSGLEVYKSSEARHMVSGLAGTINLQTRRPFDLTDGWTASARAEVTNDSLGSSADPSYSTFVGYNHNHRFGATLNLSYSDSNLSDYKAGKQGDWWQFNATEASNFVTENVDVLGNGHSNDVFWAPQGWEVNNRFVERERIGVNGAIQFQITDAFELTGDVFYTNLEEYQYDAGFVIEQAWQTQTGWFTPDVDGYTAYPNIVSGQVVPNSNYVTVQSGTYQARRAATNSNARAIDKEAFNSNLELNFDNGGRLTGTLRWVYGSASNNDANSTVDSYVNDGSQVGAEYVGVGGERISDVNPWGYQGQWAELPDGTPVVDSYTQIPVHIRTDSRGQHWTFPTMRVVEDDGSVTYERFGSNLDRYNLTSTNLTGQDSQAELNVIRLDTAYDLSLPHLSAVSFGVRYGVRDVERKGWIGGVARTNAYGDAYLSRWKDTASTAPETGESFIDPISFTQLNKYGMIKEVSDFHGATGLGSLWVVDPESMKDPLAWHDALYGVNIQVPNAADTYKLEEVTQSVYLQLDLDGDIFGLPYTGNIGARYVRTDFDILQSEALSGSVATFNNQEYYISSALGMLKPDGAHIRTETGYGDLLPAFNMAFDVTSDQVLRLAANKTVSTHNTHMLGGGLTVNRTLVCGVEDDQGNAVFCATGGSQSGNPHLEPNRNTNAEMSYEWYFSDSGILHLGLFWVQHNTAFETTLVQRDDIEDSDGVVRGYDTETDSFTGTVPISTTVTRSDSSYTRGLEVGYQQELDFLPGFWRNFGVQANYTYSPGSSNDFDFYGNRMPNGGNSTHQSNFAVWYESGPWEARIAHNYRSKVFNGVMRTGGDDNRRYFARFTQPTHYLDASFSYELTDNIKVNVQATNLLEEKAEVYFQWESNVEHTWYNGRRITVGIQWDL
ncbi:TonB-dependent receptor [Marinimicrobium sp. ABcell2]|uniref:TonB-dependent receptor n=1 Tax=Marinimicrobium sp. ABcell2 TaxID=3069751 RepID=UPI0027B4816C|nr:TonB-dependent receptor [Marinimicrobium sp. ABcell2]MDQ2076405.1 TonB-dependent receptor [Marinimicrobium sp. ABcell2]